MGHIVYDDFMPSYGPPKLTLVSIFFFLQEVHRNKKRHGHNFRVRGPKTNSVLKKWVSKDAIRFGTSPSKIVAVSFFRYGVLLVKKKLKRGPTSEGRSSA